jgi:hypothetical protein
MKHLNVKIAEDGTAHYQVTAVPGELDSLPEGWQFTGEARVPRPGDAWQRPNGSVRTWDEYIAKHPEGGADMPRLIVMRVPQ